VLHVRRRMRERLAAVLAPVHHALSTLASASVTLIEPVHDALLTLIEPVHDALPTLCGGSIKAMLRLN